MHAALIEFYPSHDECLYSQIRFLKAGGYTVHLICDAKLQSRTQDLDLVDDFLYLPFGAGEWADFRQLLKIRRYLMDQKIQVAVLNTARGSRIRNLLLLPSRRTQFIGIGHIANKIFSGFTSRLIRSKVKKYFVLNDYILPQLPRRQGIRVSSMYPIFFPPFKHIALNKPADEFWVCIPGGIEFARKDYNALVEDLLAHSPDPRIRFVLLGKSNLNRQENREFVQRLKARALDQHFIWFEDYVDGDIFFSYLQDSDLILPLIHPQKPRYAEYITYKISGAFNLAFGFQIPMLCERTFSGLEDFDTSSFFYAEGDLIPTLNSLLDRTQEIQMKREAIRNCPKFQFSRQRDNYLRLISA